MLRNRMRITLALLVAFFATACMAPQPMICSRSFKLGHPTMTAEEISIGLDGHVRAVSEGATPSQHSGK